MSTRKLGFVVPRYGEQILGGAETLARHLAEELARRGDPVAVLTTCATNHITWKNVLPPGQVNINGVEVERFPMRPSRSPRRYCDLNERVQLNIPMPVDEQFEWVDTSPHSPALYQALARRLDEFEFLFFIPYLYPTTYYGSAVAPARSIIWPCLHDESYAYLAPTLLMLCDARGIMFNSEPERGLAEQKLELSHAGARTVGFGLRSQAGDGHRFRRESGITEPFILYSGRIERSKNVHRLVESFIAYRSSHSTPLKLVLMGAGVDGVIPHPDIHLIGFKQGQDKADVYAAATLLCQPSVNESFSIVIMESWLMGVPVLVHRDCAVTRHHVTASGGGGYFGDDDEFAAVVERLLGDDDLRRRMGRAGQAYVQSHYNWPAVLARFDAALAHWRALG